MNCICPNNQIYKADTNKCECPPDFELDPDDKTKCKRIRVLPKRPLHDNEDGLESVPAGQDNIKRDTTLQLLSVSPLDRLLNQRNHNDDI